MFPSTAGFREACHRKATIDIGSGDLLQEFGPIRRVGMQESGEVTLGEERAPAELFKREAKPVLYRRKNLRFRASRRRPIGFDVE